MHDLKNAALLAKREGRLPDATRLLSQALAGSEAAHPAVHAELYNMLADVHRKAGEAEAAVTAARAGLQARRKTGSETLIGNDLTMLALVLEDAGQKTEAITAAEEARAVYVRAYGEDHTDVTAVDQILARLRK